ncbi:hypothetical protein INT43_005820 [Umbelopsis isabellina]|uniref:C2H2-type domain-containing protein n=1 Tax=Mortierella isabellina TaxID=91625 RepID=A0A8H7PIT2_MORIS|nr:hypothetical protein INT43_005820 [Umbelopsis isabellina]
MWLSEEVQLVEEEHLADSCRYCCAICDETFVSVADINIHFQVQHLEYQSGADETIEEQNAETDASTAGQIVKVEEEIEVLLVSEQIKNPFLEQGNPSVRVASRRKSNSEQLLSENLYSTYRPKLTTSDFTRMAGSFEFEVVGHSNLLTALSKMVTIPWLKPALDLDPPSEMF